RPGSQHGIRRTADYLRGKRQHGENLGRCREEVRHCAVTRDRGNSRIAPSSPFLEHEPQALEIPPSGAARSATLFRLLVDSLVTCGEKAYYTAELKWRGEKAGSTWRRRAGKRASRESSSWRFNCRPRSSCR